MKVLIVDDSPDALAIAKVRLAEEHVEVLCADSGPAGLAAAEQESPDLILLDLDMPGMSGYDVCRTLKQNAELCMIPVIFLSGVEGTDEKVKALDLGAVDFVAKPFDAFELRARVRAALRTKRLQDLLVRFAQIDPLTELGNRRALAERLGQEWARIERHGGSLAFIMADVDDFKRINDAHGHHVGDQVLREIAKLFAGVCRESDFPARQGGDEFAIVCPEEHADGAARLAERCRHDMAELRLTAGGEALRPTASFGVADSTGATSEEDLIRRADEALYRAKHAGRNRVEVDRAPDTVPTEQQA